MRERERKEKDGAEGKRSSKVQIVQAYSVGIVSIHLLDEDLHRLLRGRKAEHVSHGEVSIYVARTQNSRQKLGDCR